MKHKIKFLTIATIIINMVCCTPDCKEGGIATPENLSKKYIGYLFPYGANQNLKYLKNGKDTILFYNQGYKSGYNFTFTQEDCTRKVPLEFKSLLFFDSLSKSSIELYLYINQYSHSDFKINFNDKVIFEENVGDFIILTPPYISLKIGDIRYDTLAYKINAVGDYLYYKTIQYGLIKFKTNNNTFEIIP